MIQRRVDRSKTLFWFVTGAIACIVPQAVECMKPFRASEFLEFQKNLQRQDLPLPKPTSSSSSSLRHPSHHHHDSSQEDVKELFFTQRLDHFNGRDERTFQQRYFYSDRYVSEDNATTSTKPSLAFLCVGGEGPSLDKSVLVDSVHCTGDMLEFAKTIHEEFNIHLFALEHRYYGKSYPDFGFFGGSPVSNKNLIYLSSRQAIADIAKFVTLQNTKKPHDIKWITFGGSYPGVLAAWSRLKLPHLIAAAVSSAAPLQVVVDFSAYNAHVAKAFADPVIGGSPQCLQIFHDGHEQLARAAQNRSRHAEIAQKFQLCNAAALQDHKNIELFVGSGVRDRDLQSNDPACTEPLCNVQSLCTALINMTTVNNQNNSSPLSPMDALAVMVHVDRATMNKTDCLDIDWQASLNYLSDPILGQPGGMRSWMWQTCTEVGFYQTCERNSTCPYARGWHLLSQDLDICETAFDVTPQQVAKNVQDTNEYYGGWNFQATRVLSVTGSIDPWSEMALRKTHSKASLPIYYVPGASHHYWTHPVKETDGKEIQQAREIIFTTLRGWIKEMDEEDVILKFLAATPM